MRLQGAPSDLCFLGRGLRALAVMAALGSGLYAQGTNANDLLAAARKEVQTADFRATGHLVAIDAGGARTSFPVTIKARWLPGVLHILVDLGQPPSTHHEMREHILLEMRPNGENTIVVAAPGDAAARVVPFEKWNAHPLGPGFNYEDFLEQQYFWPGQSSEGKAKFGARDCEIVKSTPGPNDRTHYAQVKTWIDSSIGFPVYAEKTAKETGAVKEFTSYGVRREMGHWSAHQLEVKIRGQAGSTLLIFDRGSVKASLTAADFNPARLTHF